MERVINDLREQGPGTALVRLWVMAGIYENGDRTINAWEGISGGESRKFLTTRFRRQLQDGDTVDAAIATKDPLALVQALDTFLADEMRAGRPQSRILHEVDGVQYSLVRHPLKRRQLASRVGQANNRESWFLWHSVIPEMVGKLHSPILVKVLEPDLATAMALSVIAAATSIRIFVAHFNDDVRLEGVSSEAGKRFFTGLDQPAKRSQSIRATLDRAHKEGAHVVVFPELTVTPDQREEIAAWHRGARKAGDAPTLIVSGSFHEEINGRKVNRAELLGLARPLLVHEKIRPFGRAAGFAEDFQTGNRLELLTTALGLIAMPICKDFNDSADGLPWSSIAPDWCLVPSMGDEQNVSAHARRAKELWDVLSRTVSAVANQELDLAKTKAPGFCHADKRMDVEVGGQIVEVSLNA